MKNKYFNFKWLLILLFASQGAWAQQFTISGKVTDEATSEGLVGVNVLIKGTSTGTITDVDGNYNLGVPNENATLVYSFIGYLSQEFNVTNSMSQLNVQLVEDITKLEEIVVTGLASSVKRSNLANAVSTVSGDELTGATSVQTLDGALQGKLTGANIIRNSGAPGGGISMKLRGITTITGSSEPLYIVDGVYMDNTSFSAGTNPVTASRTNGEITDEQDNPSNRIADLNPQDIENIEILKGASAAAIYGSRANAGVVLITTKRGQQGKTKINFQQDVGFAEILNPLGVRNFTDDIVLNAFNEDELAKFRTARDQGRLIDYEDVIYGEKALLLNTSLSLSGGTEKTKFFVSALNKDEDGIIDKTGYKKQSVRANIDHKISDLFDFSINTNYIHSSADRAVTNNDNAGVSLGIALTSTVPWDDLFPDENGIYPNNPKAASNPLQTRDLSTINETTNRIVAGGKLNLNILRKDNAFLQLILQGGIDNFTNETTVHFPEVLQFQAGQQNGFYSRGNNTVLNTNVSAIAVFNTSISNFDLTSQLGAARLKFDQERLTTQATQLIGAQTNLSQASALAVFNKKLTTEDIGYFFQQEANWEDRLIATAGIRLDKSSLNGDTDKLFGYPKFSLAANLHNFSFFDLSNVDQLKLRVAYGEAGGVPAANANDLALPTQTVFTGANILNIGGGALDAGSLIGDTRGNPDIKPERSKEFEAGVDIGVLSNRVTLEATYYNKTVEDLILRAEVAESQGFAFQTLNAGELKNTGWELALGAMPLNTSNVQWNTRVSWWRNRSEMTRLDIPEFTTGAFSSGLGTFQIKEGESVTQIVGPTPESGSTLVKIGDAEPDFQMSWLNSVTFLKNFEFSMLWHWKEGGDNVQLTSLLSDFGQTSFDYDDDDDGNGVVNGDQRINALVGDTPDAREFVEESTYLKLREVGIYYNIPQTILQNAFNGAVGNVRVGASANNVLLFSDYRSYDPEVSNFGNDGVSSGVEVTPFPTSRRLFLHLSVGF
ncbi:MAG: SusC/RagA family TonB-linked outer membrane protein [Cyclobacteriaceae bacterium]